MELLKVIVISIIQGVAEFLPISSSGHIFLFKRLLNLDFDLSFDLTIHLGTLFAVIVVYAKDIWELIKGVFVKEIHSSTFSRTLKRAEILHIYLVFIIATIPAGILGLLLNDFISDYFVIENTSGFLILAIMFLYTTFLLLFTAIIKQKSSTTIDKMGRKQALAIGIFQALAVFPGVSRSGSTISSSLFFGIEKKDAGRFSFLLSIPLIVAACGLEFVDFIKGEILFDSSMLLSYTIGLIVSFITGLISLKLLLSMIQKGKIWFFSLYMSIPVVISFVLFLFG